MKERADVYEDVKKELMPFESWERLPGESGSAYAAFCAFRDLGLERNIRKAVELGEKDEGRREKRYRMWRNWCSAYRWRERAAEYDRYMERLKQAELRKTIEAQGERQRAVTGKMLAVVEKKLDLMDPAELTQGAVTEWVEAAIRAEREAGQFADANCLGVSTSRNSIPKQGEINFSLD
ncbi:MAG: hypothetical protein LBB68_11390, partial [Treponema sp.]|nr:hypothetical protein [Treponema sp.]